MAERAQRAATVLERLETRLRSRSLSVSRALDLNESLAGLRVAAGFPARLIQVDLSFHALSIADAYRESLHHHHRAWLPTLATGRRLIWQLLAAGEGRAARLVSSAVLTAAGYEFSLLHAALTPEEFHLTSTLEALAEFTYVGGPVTLFERLGAETVYDRSRTGETPVYTFRGSLSSRPAYQRLPGTGSGELERFRKHVLDELAVHTRQMLAAGADPRQAAPLELWGLVVLGHRVGLTVRKDLILPASLPYVTLVQHLLI